jgi:RimJ/RimL family protein N-acetyltransferase
MSSDSMPDVNGAGEAVRLLPADASHAGLWLKWRAQEQARRHMPLAPSSVGKLAERLAACTADLSDRSKGEYRWIIALGGEVVGTVAALAPSWEQGYTEITYMVAAEYHGRGVGSRAVALLLDALFRETELQRIFAVISADNVASRKLVERFGFKLEGVMREHFLIGGRRVDQTVYGLLRREYSAPQRTAGRRD